MTKPIRIQRKRTKGWRMPAGTWYVGRPSNWGNPFDTADEYEIWLKENKIDWDKMGVTEFCAGEDLKKSRLWILDHLPELRGRNLACWCRLDEKCHADVLIEMTNHK